MYRRLVASALIVGLTFPNYEIGTIIDSSPSMSENAPRDAKTQIMVDIRGLLPERLPSTLMQTIVDSTVSIGTSEIAATNPAETLQSQGSGVRITLDKVLSAGHVVSTQIYQNKTWLPICGKTTVTTSVRQAGTQQFPRGVAAVKEVRGKYEPSWTGSDIALLTIPDAVSKLDPISPVPLHNRKIRQATPVVMAGYGVNRDGSSRNPNASVYENRQPRIIGGIVLAQEGTGLWILTGLKNYSAAPDDLRAVQAGDSGGPVFDLSGTLLGVIKGHSGFADNDTTSSLDAIAKTTGVTVTGTNETLVPSLAYARTVTPSTLTELPFVNCTF